MNMEKQPIYSPEQERSRDSRIELSDEQKEQIRNITLGVETVDPAVLEMATDDAVDTLQNNHPLNRLLEDDKGELIGYIACEDFIPHEAYIKYLATSGGTGRNFLREVPVFLKYAKEQGYTKINFHGWNDRLNKVLERFGFTRLRTDTMGDLSADFYEIELAPVKTSEQVEQERREAFEQKYLAKIRKDYEKTLATFSDKIPKDEEGNLTGEETPRQIKERAITGVYQEISTRLSTAPDFEFGDRQKAILKLKLARHFQSNEVVDINTLFDAVVESPKFLAKDKGSLHRLFETHEQKTIQKIAEMRKRKAEQTGEEGFNPFEWVYQTESGDYALARLLNMPHLEEESEYMDHCVGTSDSYINKMKRGEVEIFSVRTTPKKDPETKEMTQDEPVLTIEYNVKTGVIEQMKKANDEYLNPNDLFYNDVIEILKELRSTELDTGKPRVIRSIAKSETQHFPDPLSGHILIATSPPAEQVTVEIPWEEYEVEYNSLVLKVGDIQVDQGTPKEILAKMLFVFQGLEVQSREIAQTSEEIDDTTRVYLGALTPGIFQILPDTVEHIYVAPDRKPILRQTIEVGGKTTEELQKELKDKGIKVSSYVKSMMEHEDFITSNEARDLNTIRLSVADLGLEGSPTTDQVYARAIELGLELVPPEVGPYYRLQNMDQAMNDWVYMGMEQITDPDDNPRVFGVAHLEDGLWLGSSWAHPVSQWRPFDEFVFSLRPAELGKQV